MGKLDNFTFIVLWRRNKVKEYIDRFSKGKFLQDSSARLNPTYVRQITDSILAMDTKLDDEKRQRVEEIQKEIDELLEKVLELTGKQNDICLEK